VLRLVNQERTKAGSPELRPHALLMTLARNHSSNMARQNNLDHVLDNKRPEERAKDAGYKSYSGENVAYNQATPAEVMSAWMNSTGHRGNILKASSLYIGIGLVRNTRGDPYWTQVFGTSDEGLGTVVAYSPPKGMTFGADELPKTVTGVLNNASEQASDRYLDKYTVNLKKAQTYTIDLTGDFDTYCTSPTRATPSSQKMMTLLVATPIRGSYSRRRRTGLITSLRPATRSVQRGSTRFPCRPAAFRQR